MSQVKSILQALVKLGVATYDDLEAETKIARNKLRWSCNSVKNEGYVKQVEDAITKEVAFKITDTGRAHLVKIGGTVNATGTEKEAVDIAMKNHNRATDLEADLAKVKEQLKLAEQQRNEHFETAEKLRKNLKETESSLAIASNALTTAERDRDTFRQQAKEAQAKLDDQLLEELAEPAIDVKDAASAYIIRAKNRKPRLVTSPERAREAAMSAAKAIGRAEVLALVPIGTAVAKKDVSVQWQER